MSRYPVTSLEHALIVGIVEDAAKRERLLVWREDGEASMWVGVRGSELRTRIIVEPPVSDGPDYHEYLPPGD